MSLFKNLILANNNNIPFTWYLPPIISLYKVILISRLLLDHIWLPYWTIANRQLHVNDYHCEDYMQHACVQILKQRKKAWRNRQLCQEPARLEMFGSTCNVSIQSFLKESLSTLKPWKAWTDFRKTESLKLSFLYLAWRK